MGTFSDRFTFGEDDGSYDPVVADIDGNLSRVLGDGSVSGTPAISTSTPADDIAMFFATLSTKASGGTYALEFNPVQYGFDPTTTPPDWVTLDAGKIVLSTTGAYLFSFESSMTGSGAFSGGSYLSYSGLGSASMATNGQYDAVVPTFVKPTPITQYHFGGGRAFCVEAGQPLDIRLTATFAGGGNFNASTTLTIVPCW